MSETAEIILQGDPPISETTGNVVKGRPDIISVDNKDFNKWADKQLGLNVEPDPADMAKQELAKVEAEKTARLAEETETEAPKDLPEVAQEGDRRGPHVYFKGKWVHKNNQNYRFHIKTAEADKAREEAKVSRETAEAAKREAAELRAKYEPVKTDPDPEPQPGQFKDVAEYAKALKEWTADNTRREDAQKDATAKAERQQQAAEKAWKDRWTAAEERIPDFKEVIAESGLLISDELRDATFDSDYGPEIRYHLAKNPEYADKIGKMMVGQMLKEVGKLEDKIEAGTVGDIPKRSAGKPQTKSTSSAGNVAEISWAPAQIAPVKAAADSGLMLSGADAVPSGMSYETWKAGRQAGRIR